MVSVHAFRVFCAIWLMAAPLAAQQNRRVSEIEPNNDAATAMVVQAGDTIDAVISQRSDVDVYALDLPAGMKFQIVFLNRFCSGVRVQDPTGGAPIFVDCL